MSREDMPQPAKDLPAKVSLLHHIVQYLSEIVHGWAALVSGIASIILFILVAFWGDDYVFLKDNRKTFIWTAFICLIIAGFSTWRKERQRGERLGGLATLSTTPKELVSVFRGRTTAKGEKLAKTYTGNWIKVSGPINDVRESKTPFYLPFHWPWAVTVSMDSNHTEIYINLKFTRKWLDLVSALGKGDTISVLGRIAVVEREGIWLKSCELLEIRVQEPNREISES